MSSFTFQLMAEPYRDIYAEKDLATWRLTSPDHAVTLLLDIAQYRSHRRATLQQLKAKIDFKHAFHATTELLMEREYITTIEVDPAIDPTSHAFIDHFIAAFSNKYDIGGFAAASNITQQDFQELLDAVATLYQSDMRFQIYEDKDVILGHDDNQIVRDIFLWHRPYVDSKIMAPGINLTPHRSVEMHGTQHNTAHDKLNAMALLQSFYEDAGIDLGLSEHEIQQRLTTLEKLI